MVNQSSQRTWKHTLSKDDSIIHDKCQNINVTISMKQNTFLGCL